MPDPKVPVTPIVGKTITPSKTLGAPPVTFGLTRRPTITREAYYAQPQTPAQLTGWDWQAPPVDATTGRSIGPTGDLLPPFAKGWRPDGTPDFGNTELWTWNEKNDREGISGEYFMTALRKYASNVLTQYEKGRNEKFLVGEVSPTGALPQALVGKTPEEARALLSAKAETLEEKAQFDKDAKAGQRNLSAALAGTSQAFTGLFQLSVDLLFLPGAEIWERGIGTFWGVAKAAGENLASGKGLTVTHEQYKEAFLASSMTYATILPRFFEVTKGSKSDPIRAMMGEPVTAEPVDRGQIIEDRLLELDREGIRPDLAEEIVVDENPWAMWYELGGQLVFDPLNFIDAPLKGMAAAKRAGVAADIFLNSDRTADLVRLAKNGGNLADGEKVFLKLSDSLLDDAEKVGIGLGRSRTERKVFAWHSKSDVFNKSFQLTLGSRAAMFYRRTGDAFMTIVKFAPSPDKANEMLYAISRLAEAGDISRQAKAARALGNVAEADALLKRAQTIAQTYTATLLNFQAPNMIFSPAMQELGYFLYHSDLDKIHDILTSGEELEKIIPKLSDLMQENVAKMYPTIEDMLLAEKRIAEVGEAAAKASDKELAAMLRNKDLIKPWQIALSKANSSAVAKGIRKTQSVLSYIQLNTGGYALRNFANNELTILVDHGLDAVLGDYRGRSVLSEEIHGSPLPWGNGYGGSSGLTFEKTTVIDKSKLGFKEALKQVWGKGKIDVRRGSGVLEAVGQVQVGAKTYLDTYYSTIDRMSKELIDIGVQPDIAQRIPMYLREARGNDEKAMSFLLGELDTQTLDLFKSEVPPDLADFFKDKGVWEAYSDAVLNGKSQEASKIATEGFFNKWLDDAERAYTEGSPLLSPEIAKVVDEGAASGVAATRHTQEIEYNRIASEEMGRVFDNEMARAGQVMTAAEREAAGIPTTARAWGAQATADGDKYRELIRFAYEEGKKDGADYAALWQKYIYTLDGKPIPVPSNISKKLYNEALWTNYFGTQGTRFGNASRQVSQDIAKELARRGIKIPPESQAKIQNALDMAEKLRNSGIGFRGYMVADEPIKMYGTRSSQIAQIAKKYGFATAVMKGERPIFIDDTLLDVIKKWSGVEYTSFEDPIPLSVVENALQDWAQRTGRIAPPAAIDDVARVSGGASDAAKVSRDTLEEVPYFGMDRRSYEEGAKLTREIETASKELENAVISGVGGTKEEMAKAGQEIEEIQKRLDALRTRYAEVTGSSIPEDLRDLRGVPANADKIPYVTPVIDETTAGRGQFVPSPAKMTLADRKRIEQMRELAIRHLEKFGKKQVFSDSVDVESIRRIMSQRNMEAKQLSSAVSQAATNFTMLDYSGDKTFVDLALAYIMPYHYWYGRTYLNWVSRVTQNPAVLAAYAKYKKNLASIHAGMPEFYRTNLSTNDLPGIDMKSPLYFNLEATLWPLNAVTGIDFNDPYKRVDWWTNMLDYSGRFGPSVFQPIQMLTGIYYYQKGKREANDALMEAGSRWMGRIGSQTKTIKNVAAWIEEKTGVDFPGRFNELDPLVGLVQDGVDPYEKRQASRALAAMQVEAFDGRSPYTPEQIAEAGYTHQGPIWEEAVRRAMAERAWPQLASFFMGVGFKGRTQQDLENDKFYGEYGRIMSMRSSLSSTEWRDAMTSLQQKYPFMDTLLISNKVGIERDSGYAYSVLSRIPPARSDDYAEMVGLDENLLDKFWDDKGAIELWTQSDRDRFMAAVLDLAAVLEIPSKATKSEWTAAKNAYDGLKTEQEKRFGTEITALIEEYNTFKYGGEIEKANDLLDAMPILQQALDWRAARVMDSPLLSAYYGSLGTIEQYYKSQMRAEVLATVSKDFFDVMEEYYDLQKYGKEGEADRFYNAHKAEFKKYYKLLDKWQAVIDGAISKFSAHIPDVGAGIRRDFGDAPVGEGARSLAEGLAPEPEISIEEWQYRLTPELFRVVADHILNGTPFDYDIRNRLDDIAKYDLGYYDVDALVQAVGKSLYSFSP